MRLGNLDQAAGKQKLQIPHDDATDLGAHYLTGKTRLGKRLSPALRKQALFLPAFLGCPEKGVPTQSPPPVMLAFATRHKKTLARLLPGLVTVQ